MSTLGRSWLNRQPSAPTISGGEANASDWAGPLRDATSSMRNVSRLSQSPVESCNSKRSIFSLFPNDSPKRTDGSLRQSSPARLEEVGANKMLKENDFTTHQVDEGNTRDSAISGLSLLADDTDDFYREGAKQLLRDEQRLRDAANGEPVKAFRRARTTPNTIALLADPQRHLGTSNDFLKDARPRRNSTTTVASPEQQRERSSPNVPRQWGRKGKQTNDFLRRINSTGDMKENSNKVDQSDEDRILRRRTVYTGDSPGSYDGNTPVESVEQGSPISARRRRFSRQSSRGNSRSFRNVDDVMILEQHEAENADLGPRPGSRKPSDARQQQEIDNLRERGLTTNRLAEVGRRSVPRTISQAFRTSEVKTDDALVDLHDGPTYTETQKAREPSREREKHSRSDSRDLLKQLARVSSLSPSPRNTRAAVTDAPTLRHTKSAGSVDNAQSRPSSLKSRRDSPTKHSKSSLSSKSRPGYIQTTPSPPRKGEQMSLADELKQADTPIVSGAWTETPITQAPETRTVNREPAQSSQQSKPQPTSKKGTHAKSALERVLMHASRTRRPHNSESSSNTGETSDKPELSQGSGGTTIASLRALALDDPLELEGFDPTSRELFAKMADPAQSQDDLGTGDSGDQEGKTSAVKHEAYSTTKAEKGAEQPRTPRKVSLNDKIPASHSQASKSEEDPDTIVLPTPEEESFLRSMLIEDLTIYYLHPATRTIQAPNLETAERWDALFHSAKRRDRSRLLAQSLNSKGQSSNPSALHRRAQTRNEYPPQKIVTQSDAGPISRTISKVSTKITSSISNTFHSLHQPHSFKPSRRGYLIISLLIWLCVEETLGAIYCHPQADEWFPLFPMMEPGSSAPYPTKPFVTYWFLLRRPFWFIFDPLAPVVGYLVYMPGSFLYVLWLVASSWLRDLYEALFGPRIVLWPEQLR